MEGQSIGNELLSIFPKATETPSSAAFVQQRNKLKSGVFDTLFHSFVQATETAQTPRTFHGMRLLAVDGSDIHIPTDQSDEKNLCVPRADQTPYSMLHLNAMYDLLQRTYVDEIVQNYQEMNEHAAFVEMVDRSRIGKALVMADRNYESFNDFAHVVEKGWYFLIRVKDVGPSGMLSALDLPAEEYPPSEVKKLYAMRWGIETSFRVLKYTVGLLYFHSKKAEHIRHEIAARLIMYNFFELITSHVIVETKSRKHGYKANFTRAVHICRMFLRGDISPPDVEAVFLLVVKLVILT